MVCTLDECVHEIIPSHLSKEQHFCPFTQVKLQIVQIESLKRENDELRTKQHGASSTSNQDDTIRDLEQQVKVLQAMNMELASGARRGAGAVDTVAPAPHEWVLERFEFQGQNYLVDAQTKLVYEDFEAKGLWPRPLGKKVCANHPGRMSATHSGQPTNQPTN